ncbi:MAG: metallophosphoesterase family protein [Lentisphaeria bacterium]|nr:metallophosphoesterase family protein [Lentisphaeria bacterium]
MRILFFSDLHGNLSNLERLPEADIVFIGGDFTTLGTPQDFRNAIHEAEKSFKEFYAVAGNMDPANADEILKETGHLVPFNGCVIHGLKCMGISGSHKCPRPTPFEWDDDEMSARLMALPMVKMDILVTHAPPMGFGADVIPNGMHVGSTAIACFAHSRMPRLHLCGHIHEAHGIFDEDGFPLVNCGDFGTQKRYAVIDLQDGQPPAISLKEF